ncbi:MAG: 4Fe-4S binding protein [Candidatus Thermoplasmatota archaeon]|nr:4Fe-4S binding protein [Candidatus Thermoplasmatota archaeon]
MAVKVDKEKCTGCGACVAVCPVEAIKVTEKAEVNEDTCIDCGACVDECPVQALSL